jgi:hypothetical protein
MRFMVPRMRTRVFSNESFIFSASAEDSRISSPIAIVIFLGVVVLVGEMGAREGGGIGKVNGRGRRRRDTYCFELFHFSHDSLDLLVILAF